MDKFRVVSDIHLDVNGGIVPKFNDDVFTVVCGDTSGYPDMSINFLKKNIKNGICISGNHLPYNDERKDIQELRNELAIAFPASSSMTYLDAECGIVSKEVDGILFVGTCFYSNMQIKSRHNPTGDVEINKLTSHRMMNDFKWGEKILGNGKHVFITPDDYVEWNANALKMMEEVISRNEKLENPLPVVVVTHYPMVREVVEHSCYVDNNNFGSYGNDMVDWFKKHPSIKCHCCGHCHEMEKDWRYFKLDLDENRKLLVINNSYGYYNQLHDLTFNVNRFVDVKTWEVVEDPEPEEVKKSKDRRQTEYLAIASFFI